MPGLIFSTNGQTSSSPLVVYNSILNVNPVVVIVINSDNPDPIFIDFNATAAFTIEICARSQDGTQHAHFTRQGMVQNGTDGNLHLVGAISTIGVDINDPNWLIEIIPDTPSRSLIINVIGTPFDPLWIARVDMIQVQATS